MHKFYGATLAAIFAATSVGSILVTNAQNPTGSAHGWLAGGASVALADDGGDNQGDNDDRGDDTARNNQNQRNCYNPAGHQRGRCKHGDDNNRNNNGNNNGQQSSLRGVITSLNGYSVTLMRGLLSSITVNDQRALAGGRANNLYVGRSVTAYGYWNNGTFYATSIN